MGVEEFLGALRASLKDRSFCPQPVRERMIPKANGKLRRLRIATIRDRVVRASLKLVLEPIFEVDFLPCSYGFVCPEQEGFTFLGFTFRQRGSRSKNGKQFNTARSTDRRCILSCSASMPT
ncbi:MAG: hypothetical protein ACRDRX_13390 [Pseudonocardiaceae bacterium]